MTKGHTLLSKMASNVKKKNENRNWIDKPFRDPL